MEEIQQFLDLSRDFKRKVILVDPIRVKDVNKNVVDNVVKRDNSAEYSKEFVYYEEEELFDVSKLRRFLESIISIIIFLSLQRHSLKIARIVRLRSME